MWAVSALLALMGTIAGHVLVGRFPLAGSFLAKFIVVGGGVGLIMSAHLATSYGLGVEFWAGLLLYAFTCELYIFLVTLVTSSISVSLLLLLRQSALSRVEIDRMASARVMVATRLQKLSRNGFLQRVAGGYAVTRRGRFLLAILRALRRFFHRHAFPVIDSA